MSVTLPHSMSAWHSDFNKSSYETSDRIIVSESRSAVSTYLTETARWVNRRATKEVKKGESYRVALQGLEIITKSALQFEKKLGSSVAVQRRNNEGMHRKIAKELAELLAVATAFYDIDFLRRGQLLSNLRELHATTGTCYEGVLRDLESTVSELEEQARMAQESKMTICPIVFTAR